MNLIDDDRCLVCTADVSEDLFLHFLLECTSLSNVRNEFFEIFQSVSSYYSITFIELSPSAKLQFLIGDNTIAKRKSTKGQTKSLLTNNWR
jgi:hypothetical protein